MPPADPQPGELAKALADEGRFLDEGDLAQAASLWRQAAGPDPHALAEARQDLLDAFAVRVAAAVRGGDFATAERELAAAARLSAGPSADTFTTEPGPPAAVPARFTLWVDGVGSYLVLTKPAITVGRQRQGEDVDLPLAAPVSRRHAQLRRMEGDWFLAAHRPVTVNGQPVQSALLADGDEIQLAGGPACRFGRPTQLSATALLSFTTNCLPSRDTREVVLMADNLILSPDGPGHVRSTQAEARVVLFWSQEGLQCQVEGSVLVNGRARRAPCAIGLDDRIEARGWSFSLTGDAT